MMPEKITNDGDEDILQDEDFVENNPEFPDMEEYDERKA